MLIAYALNKTIIIGTDKKVNKLVVKIFDKDNNRLATYDFTDTDFAKIDFDTPEKVLFLEIKMDSEKKRKKIYL